MLHACAQHCHGIDVGMVSLKKMSYWAAPSPFNRSEWLAAKCRRGAPEDRTPEWLHPWWAIPRMLRDDEQIMEVIR